MRRKDHVACQIEDQTPGHLHCFAVWILLKITINADVSRQWLTSSLLSSLDITDIFNWLLS